VSAFFKAGLTEVDSPYYSHMVRWRNNRRTTRFFSEPVILAARAATDCFEPELPPMSATWGPLQRAQYLEATVFLSQYLLSSQGDRVGMAHSVESRLPFLDYRLVEFCNRLPDDLKLRGLTDKYLLRRFGREFLPDDVCKRPKRPYRAPIHRSFFSKPVPDYVGDLLSPAQIRASDLFRVDAVERLVRKADSGSPLSETDDMAVAGILSAQLVHYQFVSNFTLAEKLSPRNDDVKFCGDSALLPHVETAQPRKACTNASGGI
jgi:asparagine synthase (glutamine-hydrolysing)